MAKPRRVNVYREASELAESWINGNKSYVIERATRAGASRQILPALIFKALALDSREASRFLKAVVDVTVRD